MTLHYVIHACGRMVTWQISWTPEFLVIIIIWTIPVGNSCRPQVLTGMTYPQRNLDHTKRIFNYRLSRTRRVVENAFGIMANRFRVFLSPINLEPHKVTAIILAACCLHNFLIDNNKHTYISAANDFEDTEHVIVSGSWRNDPALSGLPSTSDRNPAETAKGQRNDIAEYFSSDHGSVPWQEYMITH